MTVLTVIPNRGCQRNQDGFIPIEHTQLTVPGNQIRRNILCEGEQHTLSFLLLSKAYACPITPREMAKRINEANPCEKIAMDVTEPFRVNEGGKASLLGNHGSRWDELYKSKDTSRGRSMSGSHWTWYHMRGKEYRSHTQGSLLARNEGYGVLGRPGQEIWTALLRLSVAKEDH